MHHESSTRHSYGMTSTTAHEPITAARDNRPESRLWKHHLAGTPISKTDAVRITLDIRNATQTLADLMQKAIDGQIWISMGYKTFSEWYVGEGLNQVRLTTLQKKAVTFVMFRDGASIRGIAKATGQSLNGTRANLDKTGSRTTKQTPAKKPVANKKAAAPTTPPKAAKKPAETVSAGYVAPNERVQILHGMEEYFFTTKGKGWDEVSEEALRKIITDMRTDLDRLETFLDKPKLSIVADLSELDNEAPVSGFQELVNNL